MSVFRPSAHATGPDGRRWEIYAYRIRLRDRDELDPDLDLNAGPGGATAELWLLDGILWLVGLVPCAVVRLADAAVAGTRALRSDEWTIEALTFEPHRESYVWTTTREYRGQVLAQVEAGIAQGDVPRPRNARFVGATR